MTAPSRSITGLSPPTRGNRFRDSYSGYRHGSIPAHAGEPVDGPKRRPKAGVYPRPRGGTHIPMLRPFTFLGLSPPTRGIPLPAGRSGRIPAVYPRPRGGTMRGRQQDCRGGGLSPPTRGNRHQRGRTLLGMRSIPAHAGEPSLLCAPRTWCPVYPRPRGGTIDRWPEKLEPEGLSPPTRGNRVLAVGHRHCPRSIPAHAGEPLIA